MLPDTGHTPVSLVIDLSGYEDDWRHVAAFRGQSGWLLMAQATIQSEHDLLNETLIVACDNSGNAIPAWRAKHLGQCHWSGLDYCYDDAPEILDELLCEEEGAFYARWQRQANAELATLHDSAEQAMMALEQKGKSEARRRDRQMRELKRQWRFADDDMRRMLREMIMALEAEEDAAQEALVMRRASLRRRAEEAEEALWDGSDVLIEVEPLRLIRWRDGTASPENRPARIWRAGEYHAPTLPYERGEPEEASVVLAQVAASLSANAVQRREESGGAAKPKPAAVLDDLPKSAPIRKQLSLPTIALHEEEQIPLFELPRDCDTDRALLVHRLKKLEEKGKKFFPRSRKFERNRMEREEVERLIAIIDHGQAERAIAAEPLVEYPESYWTPKREEQLRQM